MSKKNGKLIHADSDFANFLAIFFLLENDRFIFNLKLFASTFGCGLAPSSQKQRILIENPLVNFTNILWAAFAPKSFCQKITNPNCKHVKAVNFGMTVNFTNILQAAFSNQSSLLSFYVLTIWVCNFLAKGFWRKSCS